MEYKKPLTSEKEQSIIRMYQSGIWSLSQIGILSKVSSVRVKETLKKYLPLIQEKIN